MRTGDTYYIPAVLQGLKLSYQCTGLPIGLEATCCHPCLSFNSGLHSLNPGSFIVAEECEARGDRVSVAGKAAPTRYASRTCNRTRVGE